MTSLVLALALAQPTNATALFRDVDGGWTLRTTTGSASSSTAPSYVNVLVDGGAIVATQGPGEDGGRQWNVSAYQGTSPWTVGGFANVLVDGGFVTAQITNPPLFTNVLVDGGAVVATQGTSRDGGYDWGVSANLDRVGGNVIGTTIPIAFDGGWVTAKISDGTTSVNVIAATNALKSDIASVAGTAAGTAAAGVLKVGIVGNANAAIDAANNGAAPANVIVGGFEAAAQTTTQPTAATAGNVRRGVTSTDGALYVRPGGPVTWSCFVQAVTATTQCLAAPAAGLRAYVTSVTCDNQAATVQTIDVVFGTGAACVTGTTALTHKYQMGTNATTTSPDHVDAYYVSPLVPTAANAICVRPSAATAFGCTLTGYTAP